jgi:hypothetical protein
MRALGDEIHRRASGSVHNDRTATPIAGALIPSTWQKSAQSGPWTTTDIIDRRN